MSPLSPTYTPQKSESLYSLAASVISLLKSTNSTLACAESLTAGLLMAALTSVPGASSVFRGGVVSYATPLKQHLLHVDAELIAKEGVIHADVAAQMAMGARNITVCDGVPTTWGIGTTGVAGPSEQDGKPVGMVYIGVASAEGAKTWGPFSFAGGRESVREATVLEALLRLRDELVARGTVGEVMNG
ncbi:competence/damage-inducible protein CinA [Immersiella caudata]|uniref:Competence/damage-inducible protein CinA n=1 Tax=Immersiella caudata TaxID=314043 RepID=A0AA39WRC4_9PEZI|nr:competence/damage-inducible protein CinA [Immersiella caudata]